MAKPAIITDLTLAIHGLELAQPYSTSPGARTFRSALINLKGIEAVLITIDAFKPGILSALEQAACEEMQLEHDEPDPEVMALVRRYTGRTEPLR